MKLTNELRLQILAYLADDTKPTPSGHVCRFVPLTETMGAKIYGCEPREIEKAHKAHEAQRAGFEHGLAPEPGERFRIKMRLGSRSSVAIHGYLTEIVRVDHSLSAAYLKAEDRLIERMIQHGFGTCDVGPNNCGWNRENELVCLDWDPLSIGG